MNSRSLPLSKTGKGPGRGVQEAICAVVESIHATRSLQPEVYVFHATGALAAEFHRMCVR